MQLHKTILFFGAYLLLAFSTTAQERNDTNFITSTVLFPANQENFDPEYVENRGNLRNLYAIIRKFIENPRLKISKVKIIGSASTHEIAESHEKLALQRAMNIAEFIGTHISLPDSIYKIETDSNLPECKVIIGYTDHDPLSHIRNQESDTIAHTPLFAKESEIESLPTPARLPWYLHSNLLIPFMNVGIEIPLGRRLSFGTDYYFPWLKRESSNKNCFQVILFSGDIRWHFGHKTTFQNGERDFLHRPHSIGINCAYGFYDLERNWKGIQGSAWSAGFDYRYSLSIASDKVRLQLLFGVGYVQSKATSYKVKEPGGALLKEPNSYKLTRYVGPTRLGLILAIPIR